jgi:hypothetical protein
VRGTKKRTREKRSYSDRFARAPASSNATMRSSCTPSASANSSSVGVFAFILSAAGTAAAPGSIHESRKKMFPWRRWRFTSPAPVRYLPPSGPSRSAIHQSAWKGSSTKSVVAKTGARAGLCAFPKGSLPLSACFSPTSELKQQEIVAKGYDLLRSRLPKCSASAPPRSG